jgi:hypothetical protein
LALGWCRVCANDSVVAGGGELDPQRAASRYTDT